MKTMASTDNSIPFDLEGYINKLDTMKNWVLEAEKVAKTDQEKKHLTDLAYCYAFCAEQTLNYVTGKKINGT